MSCKKRIFLRTVLAAVMLVAFMPGVNKLQAQQDPGPRPVGSITFRQVCGDSAKFPGFQNCIAIVQPPPDPLQPDTGAGNIVNGAGNQGGLWFQALRVFEVPAVVGPVAQTGGATFPGLGPSFNAISCFQCHSQPVVGGSSPNTQTPGFPAGNPQLGDAPTPQQLTAVTTAPPGFDPILDPTGNGPVREVRFPNGFAGDPRSSTDAVSAGAVANLFVNTGPAGCVIGQEPFQNEIQNHNVIFRIPIPVFGEGFVENTTDDALETNLAQANNIANNFFSPPLNIHGGFNHSGNDQTISRFGWKAQNKSLEIFSGEASNVELGVTNDNFPNERTDGNGNCAPNFEPEDDLVVPPLNIPNHPELSDPRTIGDQGTTPGILTQFGAAGVASEIASLVDNFTVFMRLNAPPSQCAFNSGLGPPDNMGRQAALCFALDCTTNACVNPNPDQEAVNSIQRGKTLFGTLAVGPAAVTSASIGCVLCHGDQLRTTTSQAPALNNNDFHPFSDFAIHTMDSSLADGVVQGEAGGAQFRTAPLWGVGQRLFFLHDGRASDLVTAIVDHAPSITPTGTCTADMGEACEVIKLFQSLPATSGTGCSGNTCVPSQEDILKFLRSL